MKDGHERLGVFRSDSGITLSFGQATYFISADEPFHNIALKSLEQNDYIPFYLGDCQAGRNGAGIPGCPRTDDRGNPGWGLVFSRAQTGKAGSWVKGGFFLGGNIPGPWSIGSGMNRPND